MAVLPPLNSDFTLLIDRDEKKVVASDVEIIIKHFHVQLKMIFTLGILCFNITGRWDNNKEFSYTIKDDIYRRNIMF